MKTPALFGSFVCSCTSVWDGRPCVESVLVPYVRVDRRTVDDPMKNQHIGAAWYQTGRNHRVEEGMIARDFDGERWMVNLPDASAFEAFCAKYKRVVLSIDTDGTEPVWEIEIYDDYRE